MIPKTLVVLLVAAAVLDLTLAQRPITRNRVASSVNRGRSRTLTTTTTTTTTTMPPPTVPEDEETVEIVEEEIIVEEPAPVTAPPPTVRRVTLPRVTVPATPAPTTAARRPTTNARTTAAQVTPSPSTTRARPVATPDLEEDIKGTNVVGTVRRYSTLNADGSFTFGYENEDGSFKEETRGADCVVRGKYGYIDPDGVRREFTYVSGNPCDPNARDEDDESNEDNRPVNIPARRPVVQVQQSSEEDEDEATLLQKFNVNPQPPRTQTKAPPRKVVVSKNRVSATTAAPRVQPQRQQIQEETFFGTATPAPTRQTTVPRSVAPAGTPSNQFNFDAEVARFNAQPQPARPAPVPRPVFSDDEREEEEQPSRPRTGTRTFTSELIFDRNTNQFQSSLVQRIPDQSDIAIRERLIGFVPSTSTTEAPVRVAITTAQPTTAARTQPPATTTTTARPRVAEPEINFSSFGPSADQLQRQRQQQQQQNVLRQQAQPQPQTFFANQPQQPQPAFPSQQFGPNNAFPVQDHRFAQPQFNNFGGNPFPAQQTPPAGGFPGAFGASPSQPQATFFPNQPFPQQQPQPQRFAPSAFSAPAPAPVRTQSTPVRPAQPRPAVDPNTFASGQIDAFLSG